MDADGRGELAANERELTRIAKKQNIYHGVTETREQPRIAMNNSVAGKAELVDNSRRQEQHQKTRARKADCIPGEFLSVVR